ncbi:hypothetical protein BU24DRAFT_203674 [Aaosphaeria arxii CBS 175.79]|uniref:F-box domain-containing protein n=1 Tax=Aaosphaeria arxii CBS 175.79 TaxID=1450172 RepID=A0A6A5XUY7_9PLEO|nr:uncharacterized protein BU24DRAFT_203674 [Aaosphaeria arxii CBS 175.79]KAF2016521.1 hypothetical protein BU24DRAFT_203674 [Aaosphaeria arxii CBS 175.79]
MSILSTLPSNILPLVFNHLSRKDHYSLTQTCRFLYRESGPYLYRNITFTAKNSFSCAERLVLLLRTLLEQPHLASLIRTYRLLGPQLCWNTFDPWPPADVAFPVNRWGLEGCSVLSKTQMLFASSQFSQLVDKEMHDSPAQFKGRSKDALALMVLTRLTQLVRLEIGEGFMIYSLFLPQILRRAPELFPRLGYVILGDKKSGPEDKVSYMDLNLIRPIFYTPTIQAFELSMTQPWRFDWKQPTAPLCENLTVLDLFRSNIHRELLAELLSTAPHLKRLSYEHDILIQVDVPGLSSPSAYTNINGLNKALSKVGPSLEQLRLTLKLDPASTSLEEMEKKGISFPPIEGTLVALRPMQNLSTIDIPMIMILGWVSEFAARVEEVIPACVVHLTLSDDFSSFCPWISGFNCFRKIGLIGAYIVERGIHAPEIESFKLRMTEPRKNLWLNDAVQDLRAQVTGSGASYDLLKEDGVETHCWRFDT